MMRDFKKHIAINIIALLFNIGVMIRAVLVGFKFWQLLNVVAIGCLTYSIIILTRQNKSYSKNVYYDVFEYINDAYKIAATRYNGTMPNLAAPRIITLEDYYDATQSIYFTRFPKKIWPSLDRIKVEIVEIARDSSEKKHTKILPREICLEMIRIKQVLKIE